MSHLTEAVRADVTPQYAPALFEVHESGGEAATYPILVAAMILDSSGIVRYCHADAARLFRARPNTLVGRHVSKAIPDLPFTRRTPGYNIAYAAFWAPEGLRGGFRGVDSQGRSFCLQVALDNRELEKHHQILLRLQLPVESTQLPEHRAGYATDQHRRACMDAGAEYFLDKSSDFPRIRQIVEEWALHV